ncbi:hypothetical protein [Leptospira jelokensis]|uniref:hypothetical protein n=1 Tax=Leptospira jelokensis TaxID=2484931 RepID=UPI001090BC7A|nr:hypothetical protein [Leptospira jelokensis]TGL99253.1 hypothetical protein EHQ79_15690 [Leptospira jelokensis]
MKPLLIILLASNLLSFLIFLFFPTNYKLLTYANFAFIFILCFFSIKYCLKHFKDKKITLSILPLLFLFSVVIFIMESRWKINPFGMIDAYAMWVGKGRVLALTALHTEPIPLWNSYWRMPNYPLGIPFLHANLSVAFPQVEDFLMTIKIPNYIYLLLLFVFLFERMNEFKKGFVKFLFVAVSGAFLTQPNFLLITSDLCADFPVSVLLGITTYFLLNLNAKSNQLWLLLTIALLINLKSEAMLTSSVAFFFALVLIYQSETKFLKFAVFSLLVVFLLSIPTFYLITKGSFLSTDFNEVKLSKIQFLKTRFLNIEIWIYILSYWKDFYITQTNFISLFPLMICLKSGDSSSKFSAAFYLLCVTIFSGIFLVTSLDPKLHLEQAFARIHLQLFLIPLILCWYLLKINEDQIYQTYNQIIESIIKKLNNKTKINT